MTFTFVEIYRGDICQVLINWKYSNAGKSGPFWRIFFQTTFLNYRLGKPNNTLSFTFEAVRNTGHSEFCAWSRDHGPRITSTPYEITGIRVHWCTSTGLAPAAPAPGSAAATTGSTSRITTFDITTLDITTLDIYKTHLKCHTTLSVPKMCRSHFFPSC